MKTWIYFVRHGEVVNPKNIWYGRLPKFNLSTKGRIEIEQTAKFLSNQNIDLIYSSPLLRARQTAEIIRKELHLNSVFYLNNLLEVHSSMEGKLFSYLRSIDYDVYADPNNKIIGETIEELAKRMKTFIDYVTKIHKGKRIVAVSHGDPIMMVRAIVKGLPIKNASLHPGEENYIKHGEAYLVERDRDKLMKIKSVFRPKFR